jgi:hypothetical protein
MVEKLASAGCTAEQIGAILEVNHRTIERRFALRESKLHQVSFWLLKTPHIFNSTAAAPRQSLGPARIASHDQALLGQN